MLAESSDQHGWRFLILEHEIVEGSFGRALARPEEVYDYAKYSATLELAFPIRGLRARFAIWLCITKNYASALSRGTSWQGADSAVGRI